MKKNILIYFFVIPLLTLGQNKIQNQSFELGNYDNGEYADKNFDAELQDWKCRYNDVQYNQFEAQAWHSPDWFVGPVYIHDGIDAYTGNGYIGMKDYELAQQQLTGNNKLEVPGEHYCEMMIYLSSYTVNSVTYNNVIKFTNYYNYHIYVAKNVGIIEMNLENATYYLKEYMIN